jgi:hypothetical protein
MSTGTILLRVRIRPLKYSIYFFYPHLTPILGQNYALDYSIQSLL